MTVERPVEIELKYAVADKTIGERLLNAETLAGFRAIDAPRPTQHEDRYIDSADGALARAGFAARLRTASNGTLISVKALAGGDGALHRREELEGPADGLEVFAPNGKAFRFPAWSIQTVLQPWIVRRGIYGGVRRDA